MKARTVNTRHSRATGVSNGRRRMADMRTPDELDFKRSDDALKKLVRENKEWLKEMAEK